MKIEFLKLIKNIPIIIMLILWIIISVLSIPSAKFKFPEPEIFVFNGLFNKANSLIYTFNSIQAFIAVMIIPVICNLAFIKEMGIFNASRDRFFKKSLFTITFFKVLAIGTVLVLTYTLVLLIYITVIYFRLNLSLFQSFHLIAFLYFKFALNSILFSYFLLLFQSLLSWRRSIIYYVSYIGGLLCVLFFINRNYTPFNWYMNGLGYMNRLYEKKSFRVEHDFNSELLLTSLVCVCCLIFYFLYERRKAIY